jgi:hypothetical protein
MRRFFETEDGRRESVTPARLVDDVTYALLSIPKSSPKRRDMDANVGLVNERARPNQPSEFPFFNDIARSLRQNLQYGQRAISDVQGPIALQQDAL